MWKSIGHIKNRIVVKIVSHEFYSQKTGVILPATGTCSVMINVQLEIDCEAVYVRGWWDDRGRWTDGRADGLPAIWSVH